MSKIDKPIRMKSIFITLLILFTLIPYSAAGGFTAKGSTIQGLENLSLSNTLTTFDLVVTSGNSITLANLTIENRGHYTQFDEDLLINESDQPTAFIGVQANNNSLFTHANLILEARDSVFNIVKNSPLHPFSPNASGIINDASHGTFVPLDSRISWWGISSLDKDEFGNIENLTGMENWGHINQTGLFINGSMQGNYTETDPIFSVSPASSFTSAGDGLAVSPAARIKWDSAFDWGNHAGLYDPTGTSISTLISHLSTYNHPNYDIAYSWGDHAVEGYLTSYIETDPVFLSWDKSTGILITESQISDLTHTPAFDGNITRVYNSLGVLNLSETIVEDRFTVSGSESMGGYNATIEIENTATGGDRWFLRAGATGTPTPAGGFSIADTSAYRFVIAENGYVGIGTTVPSKKLDINGGLLVGGNAIVNGDVGIGTSNPGLPLEVRSADDNQIFVFDSRSQAQGVGGGIAFGAKYNDAGGEALAGRIGVQKTNGISGNVSFDMVFETQDWEGVITERMILTGDGKVGIGVENPSETLDLVGNIKINGNVGFTGFCVNITYSGGIAVSCND